MSTTVLYVHCVCECAGVCACWWAYIISMLVHVCICLFVYLDSIVHVCWNTQRKCHSYTAHRSNKLVLQNVLSAQCQLYNFSPNIVQGQMQFLARKVNYISTCTCMSKWHHLLYVSHHVIFSIHMQFLNDGYIHLIHPPCPFPLHCSSVKRWCANNISHLEFCHFVMSQF